MGIGRAARSVLGARGVWRLKKLLGMERVLPRPPGEGRCCRPSHKMLVATHHKTGTKWMGAVFKKMSQELSLDFRNLPAWAESDAGDVLLQDHSRFGFSPDPSVHRGLHLIRDPRDVIVSACFYHMRSDEEQLHRPRKEFGGRSYQEALNSMEDPDDRLLFEMENDSRGNIRQISDWDYSDPVFLEVRYEDLIVDRELELFHDMFVFLGLPGWMIPTALAIAYNNSLFSGEVDRPGHVRSGRPAQWRSHFREVHKRRFLELFGDVLVRLGYEEDDDWPVME